MNLLALLRRNVSAALGSLAPVDDIAALADMVATSQDTKFGDYQANCAMPLGKMLGRPPREIANEIVAKLNLGSMCHAPEIAGPGFINLRLNDTWLAEQLQAAVRDERLGVGRAASPKSFIIDYSAPNVAKPMHVGHIRSTVIGDANYRVLKFLGHHVIGDNHLGDWGTQFGMIIYGYKHFRDDAAYKAKPVEELSRLYRLVHKLVDYYETRASLPKLETDQAAAEAGLQRCQQAPPASDPAAEKKAAQVLKKATLTRDEACKSVEECKAKLTAIDNDPAVAPLVRAHTTIATDVLQETAKLHAGDAENVRLWKEFMPPCLAAINEVYQRLGVTFDETLGESFYHDQLPAVVEDLERRGLARESDGALCVFLEGHKAPMIVRKKDGAFLYSTTDLATIRHRIQQKPAPDAILYVVDHRQSLHFEQLFAVARLWGCEAVDLRHVSFGTVLGKDGKPYKTRSGDTVGLTGLLDEAVSRALKIVSDNDDAKPSGRELTDEQRQDVAEAVGISALKYADLSQNRTSDYEFSYDKMLAMNGNTATYMQYAYARVRSIFRRGQIDIDALRQSDAKIELAEPAEKTLARQLLRFEEALEQAIVDYRPNLLTAYLFELANAFSSFFDQCPVLKAPSEAAKNSRLLLCDLTARTIKQGLELLGIPVVEQM